MTDDLRARIADALEAADYRPGMRRGDLADAVLPVVEAEQAEYDETVVGALNERIIRLEKRAGRAEAERDRLAAGVPLVCSDDRHQARVRGLEAVLARVREYCGALAEGSCRVQAAVTARDVLDLLDGRPGAEDGPVPPAAGSGADGEQQRGYAGESERNPDGTCPDWCPCHRMRAEGEQR